MYLCTIDCVVRAPGQVLAAELDALATALVRNGQLVGCFVMARTVDGYQITGTSPQLDALEARYHSHYVVQLLQKLEDDFGVEFEIDLQVHEEPPLHASSLDVASELYLMVYPHWGGSPLLADTGLHIPLYLVPFDPDQRERTVMWAAQRQYLQRIEFHSGALEREAARAITSATGLHADEGRAICRSIESATSLPTYYGMYCPTDLVTDLSGCPACGSALEVRVAPNGERLRICVACRLLASD